MTKTILFISPTGTMDNGAEISIFHLMKLLRTRGYRVLNAFPDYGVPIQIEYREKMLEADIEPFGMSAVKWWWEEAPGGLPGSHYERIQSYRKNIEDLRRIIVSEKVDLVISNTVNVFQGAVAAAEEGVSHYWLIHEFPEGEFAYYAERMAFINHFSDAIFAVTGALQASISEHLPERKIGEFISYSHIDKIALEKADHCRILQIGRITDNKNQMELIKAYELANCLDVPLIFIGAEDEAYANQCKAYVQEHGLKNVSFLGYRENPWSEVTDKDIGVFTSKVETFGMVYIEALLNGLPTIVSDNKGYQSVKKIFGQGDMYHRGDIQALAEKLQEYLSDFEAKKEAMLNAQEKITSLYSLENSYSHIVQFIEQNHLPAKKDIEGYVEFLEVKVTLKDRIKQFLKSLLRLKKI